MKNAPAFQLYAADFYMDTAAWSATEVGAYFRLLLHEWINGPLPGDTVSLSRIAGVDRKTMGKFWSMNVGKKFVKNSKGEWENSRLEQTRAEQEEYKKKLINSGRIGGLHTQEQRRNSSSKPSSKPSSKIEALQSSTSNDISYISKDIYSPDCPHQKIIDLYHSILPELPKVAKWTQARQKNLRSCWNDPMRQNIDWWRDYFTQARGQPFLHGDNDRGWKADLEWLTTERNLVKVLEGKYERRNGSGNFGGGSKKALGEAQGARSDDQPYPVDAVCTE
jgi:uncharacterized protein YdaU (DUF1376 family)